MKKKKETAPNIFRRPFLSLKLYILLWIFFVICLCFCSIAVLWCTRYSCFVAKITVHFYFGSTSSYGCATIIISLKLNWAFWWNTEDIVFIYLNNLTNNNYLKGWRSLNVVKCVSKNVNEFMLVYYSNVDEPILSKRHSSSLRFVTFNPFFRIKRITCERTTTATEHNLFDECVIAEQIKIKMKPSNSMYFDFPHLETSFVWFLFASISASLCSLFVVHQPKAKELMRKG